MAESRFWKTIAILIVVGLFYVGSGLRQNASHSATGGPKAAQAARITSADKDTETLFTASQDGKTIYMWQYFSSKRPKYLGNANAVLR